MASSRPPWNEDQTSEVFVPSWAPGAFARGPATEPRVLLPRERVYHPSELATGRQAVWFFQVTELDPLVLRSLS